VEDEAGRTPLLKVLGGISFLLVLVAAVTAVIIVSFNALITREEAVRDAWERVQAVQDLRQDLLADILFDLTNKGSYLLAADEWRRAQAGVDTAPTFNEEVYAQLVADEAAARLASAIRGSAAVEDNEIRHLVDQLADVVGRLGIERRQYNEAVGIYRHHLNRIPTRWVARAFGFADVPEYRISDK